MKRFIMLFLMVLIAGCTSQGGFSESFREIKKINGKYNTTLESYPKSINEIDSLIGEFTLMKNGASGPAGLLIEYRISNLKAERFLIESQKYGSSGTTKFGFGCKPRPLILESAALRNQSANNGYQAVGVLWEFLEKYPKESKQANLSQKNAIFLNATYYNIAREASRDSGIINSFCPANRTLELYKEEFMKKTNFSEEFINKVTYEQAVIEWKKLRGIE